MSGLTESTQLQACQRYVDVRTQRALQLMQHWQQQTEDNVECDQSTSSQYFFADAFVLLLWQAVIGWVNELNVHYQCHCEAVQLLNPQDITEVSSLPMDIQHLFELASQPDAWLAQLLRAVRPFLVRTSVSSSLSMPLPMGVIGGEGDQHINQVLSNQIPVKQLDVQATSAEAVDVLLSDNINITDRVFQCGNTWLTSLLEEISRVRMLLIEY
ncbi:hypothetical protein [Zooshikella ganghwensis]|uniref:Uncharacterized protein n=1 Tax=Zooshikella ganghwensis TaxID=202772 RepID=A0A4P9VLX3_9GAMM|nr:hypothetical protein [Zooshikella ganghwensis]RDH43856.1 hypothetical protein B9G39_10595 [Zooshikella ganghwensis]